MGCTSSKGVPTREQRSARDESKSHDTSKKDERPSTRDVSADTEKSDCPICLNLLTLPKTLQCQHVLCSRCLQRYINNLNNTAKLRGFPCPICRKLTIIANPDTPRQTWVAQLETEQNGNAKRNSATRPKQDKLTVIKSKLKGDDFEPMIVDVVVLNITDVPVVVVADFNNKSVKSLFTRRGKESSSCQTLETNPFCMSLMSEQVVALTLPWSDKICFAEVTPDVRVVNSIQTSKAYYGITAIDDDCLAVSTTWQTPASVDIIDHDGKVLKSIDTDDYCENLFSDPWYLATTPSGDILVSDCQEQVLLCVDQSGVTRWRYKPRGDRMLKIPAGVACDREGNIYLVDTDKHYVIKLNEHGRFLEEVASRDEGLERPRCMTVTTTGDLYVTLENSDIRVIPLQMEV